MLIRSVPKKHPKYYAITAYQILSQKTDKEMASLLGISIRTYKNKINGVCDFTNSEGDKLCNVFNKRKDDIFLT